MEGSQAHRAGYSEPEILRGAVLNWEVGGYENRGVTFTVDPQYDSNLIDVIFVDGSGVEHIQTVEIICSDTFGWESKEFVVDDLEVSNLPRIAVDSVGDVHIVCISDSNKLMYARSTNGVLGAAEEIDSPVWTSNPICLAIAVDSSNNPHVMYSKVAAGDGWPSVHHATKNGSWVTTKAGSAGGGGSNVQASGELLIDSNDYVYMLAALSADGNIIMVENSSGSWVETTAITGTDIREVSARIDSSDDIHVVWREENDETVRYSKYTGTWAADTTIKTLTETRDQDHLGICLDNDENPWVSYTDRIATAGKVYVADGGDSWAEQELDSIAVSYSDRTRMVADRTARLCLSYINTAQDTLRLRRYNQEWKPWEVIRKNTYEYDLVYDVDEETIHLVTFGNNSNVIWMRKVYREE